MSNRFDIFSQLFPGMILFSDGGKDDLAGTDFHRTEKINAVIARDMSEGIIRINRHPKFRRDFPENLFDLRFGTAAATHKQLILPSLHHCNTMSKSALIEWEIIDTTATNFSAGNSRGVDMMTCFRRNFINCPRS